MQAGIVNGQVVKRHGAIDASAIGTNGLNVAPHHIEVTASNTYRLYESPSKYRNKYIYKGLDYYAEGVYYVTDSSGNALTAGILYYVY